MLVIIPARGGSKGLPGKNIKLLRGKPLIAYSIEVALGAGCVSRVIVSTDSDEIGEVAKHYGGEVPFMRPSYLATDDSMAMDTYFFVIEELIKREEKMFNEFIVLAPTAPLRTTYDISKAVDIFQEKKADSVISVTEAPVPVQWHLKMEDTGVVKELLPDAIAVGNRQHCEQAFVPNGSIYIFRTEILRARRRYYTERTFPYIMPRERSVDIDEQLDFDLAEFFLSRRRGN